MLLTPLGGSTAQLEALPRPDGRFVEPVVTYQESALLAHLKDSLSGRTTWDVSKASVEVTPVLRATVPAGCNYHFITGGDGTRYSFRWCRRAGRRRRRCPRKSRRRLT